MNNTPDAVNPIFCWTSTEAVDGRIYIISLLLNEKKFSFLFKKGKKQNKRFFFFTKKGS